jgi:uncharacterized membrane protein YczE
MDGGCVLAGWLFGGNVGAGTVLAAVLMGPIVDGLLRRIAVALPRALRGPGDGAAGDQAGVSRSRPSR